MSEEFEFNEGIEIIEEGGTDEFIRELGSEFAETGDPRIGQELAEMLAASDDIESADRVFNSVEQYADAWKSISNKLNDVFNEFTFDFRVNRFRDDVTGRFLKSPDQRDEFMELARRRRLVD
jgi:hypothetical protein